MSPSPRRKRLHLRVAGYRSASLKRELLNQRCESFRNAFGAHAWAQEESSLDTSFRDEDPQSRFGNGYKTQASAFLPRQRTDLGDRRQTGRHAVTSPAVAGLRARKVGQTSREKHLYTDLLFQIILKTLTCYLPPPTMRQLSIEG